VSRTDAGLNDEERGQPHVPIRLSLARSLSSVSFVRSADGEPILREVAPSMTPAEMPFVVKPSTTSRVPSVIEVLCRQSPFSAGVRRSGIQVAFVFRVRFPSVSLSSGKRSLPNHAVVRTGSSRCGSVRGFAILTAAAGRTPWR
jgi:hypothetical protein